MSGFGGACGATGLRRFDIPDPFAHHEAPVHAALLKNGKVLLIPHSHGFTGLAETYIWDPAVSGAAAFNETDNQPTDNLYCSGHAFMSDGSLFVAGGALSANIPETLAPLGITVGRWKVKTNDWRKRHDDIEWVSCPRTGG